MPYFNYFTFLITYGHFLQSSHVISIIIILTGAMHSRYNDNDHPSTLVRFLARSFLLLRAGFCGVPFAPSDAGDEWILANLQDGEWKKDIPAHAGITRRRWRCGGEGLDRKKKRQHEWSGADGSRRERERSLPTTSAFRMIDRSHCSSGRWSLMISIGWEPDPLLTLSSITSFPRDSHLLSCILKRDMRNVGRTARWGKCHLRKTENYVTENYVKLFLSITLWWR